MKEISKKVDRFTDRSTDRSRFKYIFGIDEVGRGPIAGPVTVGVSLFLNNSRSRKFTKTFGKTFGKIKDSKKLSEKQRLEWLEVIEQAKCQGWLEFIVISHSANMIDKKGISWCIKDALQKGLKKLLKQKTILPRTDMSEVLCLLDGGLRVPDIFKIKNQQTIIKGDEKEPIIAIASIVAKVHRDQYMKKMDKKYPGYGFAVHKGYGTALHYKNIRRLGLSNIHRRTFLKNFEKSIKTPKISKNIHN